MLHFQLILIVFALSKNFEWAFGQPLPYILTSPYISALEKREIQTYESVKIYKQNINQRLTLIDKYLQDYEDCQNSKYTAQENPIKATRMIRRFPKYIEPIKKLLKDGNLETELFISLDKFSTDVGYNFPGTYDYYETMDAFFSLQYMYNLKPAEIITGVINGINTGVGFTAQQSLDIARHALESKYFTLAYDWLSAIREKHVASHKIIEKFVKQLVEEHDKLFDAEVSENERYIYSSKISNSSNIKKFPVSRREEMLEKWGKDKSRETTLAEHYSYMYLCNGNGSRTTKETKELKCYFSFKAFHIFPVKVEQLSLNPDMLLFHQVVPDKWIQVLKKKAMLVIKEENVVRTLDRLFYGFDYTWLTNDDISSSIPLLAKIERMTASKIQGLNGSEIFRIGIYGNGGQFMLHSDAIPGYKQGNARKELAKDSLKTFLIYLTDVDLGGATVYPALGTSVYPEKGSALYWSNFDVNGDPDLRMLHAACPVVLGHKWIATQWIGLAGNSHGRNCTVNAKPHEMHSILWDKTNEL